MKRGRRSRSRESGIGNRESIRTGRTRSSFVRIGAGLWKARRVEVPSDARPTSARAREALFDVLGAWIGGRRVLDLFAGSGAVGLEAVSRGAASALLVDRGVRALERTLAALDPLRERTRVLRSKAEEGVRSLLDSEERFDLVFCDPPYGQELSPELARALPELLAEGGRLVIQADEGVLPPELPGLEPRGRRTYGRNSFTFFEKPAAARF